MTIDLYSLIKASASKGYSGSLGYTGSIGYAGSQGNLGYSGSLGYTGSTGAFGGIGYTGSIGYSGSTGYTGSIGTTQVSDSPPNPQNGTLWWNSTTGNLYLYYNDGDSSQWVSANNSVRGYTGSIGYTGSQGYTGSIGNIGYTGSLGYSGSAAIGGEFNTNITTTIGYSVTTSLASAFTAPSTAGLQYIVRSILISNVSTSNSTITGNFSGTLYSNISFANNIPVSAGSAVELLVKPKIMNPSDILQLQAASDSTLQALITYETQSSTKYFGAGVDVTSDATFFDLYTASGNGQIESILLVNDDSEADVKVRVAYTDGSNTIIGYLVYDLILGTQSSAEILDAPKYISSGYKIRVYANYANRLEAIIAGKLI